MTAAALPPMPGAEPRRPRADEPDPARQALEAPPSPAEIVEMFRRAEADIRHGFSLVAGAQELLQGRVGGRGWSFRIMDRHHRSSINFGDPEETLVHLRRDLWRALIERTQLRKLMSVAAWEKFDEQVEKGEPPEVTIANLEGLINKVKADGPAMLEEAVREVFDFLRPPPRWRAAYKTNTEFELGARVILSGWIDKWDKITTSWGLNHYHHQQAIALENVFRLLAGKVRSAEDRYNSELQDAIGACRFKEACAGETEFFGFKAHKNGTLHLKFKRADLVRRLNVIAGGARLKPVPDEQ